MYEFSSSVYDKSRISISTISPLFGVKESSTASGTMCPNAVPAWRRIFNCGPMAELVSVAAGRILSRSQPIYSFLLCSLGLAVGTLWFPNVIFGIFSDWAVYWSLSAIWHSLHFANHPYSLAQHIYFKTHFPSLPVLSQRLKHLKLSLIWFLKCLYLPVSYN